jgi:peptidyl-prolyl cis-trans isomerase SurA
MMLHQTPFVRRSLVVLLAFVLAGFAAACGSKPAAPPVSADAWAVVNGRQISRDQVEKDYRRNPETNPNASDEEAAAAKLAVLDNLIVQDLILAKAPVLQVSVPDTELDAAYAEARKNITDEAFTQELQKRNLSAADMRDGLRRDLLVQKVLEKEITGKVTVTDPEVAAFFEANRAQFNRTEDAYRIAQIVVTPVRDQQINNRTGNDATTAAEAAAKTKIIMDQLKAGKAFGEVAADFSEDPNSAPRGGDLGFVPVSALQQAPAALRDAVLNGTPGNARLLSGGGNYTVVLVVGKDPAGQKDLSTPGVKQAIMDGLKGRREQLLRAAYLAALRNGAVVENLAAKRFVDAQGKVPAAK